MHNPTMVHPATQPDLGSERRRAIRYPCGPGTSCRLTATVLESLEPAAIRNISTSGIGLAVGRWFEPDSVLHLELFNPIQREVRRIQIRVAYMMEDRSGEWRILGGSFVRHLEEQELRALLA